MAGIRATWRDLDVPTVQVWGAIGLGTLALGSAVGLGATAAWLIARAAELPSPAELAVAAVIVRTLGIGRGLFRYLERLVSHDAALRGMAALRERAYARLEAAGGARAFVMRRGEVIARVGADMDAVGDAIVRAVVPVGVAVLVSSLSVGIVAIQHPTAAALLAAMLLAAGIIPSLLTTRSVRMAERAGAEADGAVTEASLDILEAASEHRVWGTLESAHTTLRGADRKVERVRDAAARPAAFAAAAHVVAAGIALVGSVWIGVEAAATIGGPAATIVALVPLAAFEAVSAMPTAVTQWHRSRAAADRVRELWQTAPGDVEPASTKPRATPASPPPLVLDDVQAAWPTSKPTAPVSAVLKPGSSLGVVGPSGIGKTTLLLTVAGALPPHTGSVLFGDTPPTASDTGTMIALSAEDAHVFGTTVLENLRVARGDVTREEATAALDMVGLTDWLVMQPAGLDTMLGTGGESVSGGERRRLLLARTLLHPAPVQLIDEPAEHLDGKGGAAVATVLAELRRRGTTVMIVTHDHGILDHVDQVITLE